MENKVLLEAKELCKKFGSPAEGETTVLNKVGVAVHEGEFVAVMGQSGSGKSTLLYNISGMDKMTSGDVWFEGENLSNVSEETMSNLRLRKMGFIFQHTYLLKSMSIEDNILLPGIKAGDYNKLEIKEKADRLMEQLGIDEIRDHDITKVSGGQLQRAAICRALINEPKILFGDEPTGALNSGATMAVMDILNKINQDGIAVMLVTHDAKVAARADRVIFFADGNIEAELTLGKYDQNKESIACREEKMQEFLSEHGF